MLNWLLKNNLIVNAKNSNVIIISHSPIIRSVSLNITLDGNKLDQVPYVKLLGINIYANLDWKIHINSLSNSLSSKIGLLHRLSKFLPQSCLIILYTSLIKSVFDYSITVWGACYKTNLENLQRMQNRCAHICTNNFDFTVSSKEIIKELKWMTIKTQFSYFLGI